MPHLETLCWRSWDRPFWLFWLGTRQYWSGDPAAGNYWWAAALSFSCQCCVVGSVAPGISLSIPLAGRCNRIPRRKSLMWHVWGGKKWGSVLGLSLTFREWEESCSSENLSEVEDGGVLETYRGWSRVPGFLERDGRVMEQAQTELIGIVPAVPPLFLPPSPTISSCRKELP